MLLAGFPTPLPYLPTRLASELAIAPCAVNQTASGMQAVTLGLMSPTVTSMFLPLADNEAAAVKEQLDNRNRKSRQVVSWRLSTQQLKDCLALERLGTSEIQPEKLALCTHQTK